MPHLTFPTTAAGMELSVVVSLDRSGILPLLAAGTVPASLAVQALIDTASDVTVLTLGLPARLGLTLFRTTSTQTTVGSAMVNLFWASLSIYGQAGTTGPLLTCDPLRVMETLVPLPGIDVLIGMDVLSECLLIFDGPGKQFTLAF